MATTTKMNQPGYDIVTATAVQLVGVGLLALLADTSDNMGKIVVIVMAGFMIGWAIANTGWLTGHLGQPVQISSIFAPYTK